MNTTIGSRFLTVGAFVGSFGHTVRALGFTMRLSLCSISLSGFLAF